ncbi:MAG TPA: hypothetical protein VGG06_07830 [Thermoanaerobaculia bacterium]|jgi:hypothetical protein
MGAFYNSICVPGGRVETVRQILVRWLAAKGYEPRPGPVLFDLDGEHERSVFLVSNDLWTVLFYSHFEEERRLIHELQAELAPILYVWVYDGDVWGYDLFDERGFAGSFNSDPGAHESFGEQEGAPPRPRAGAESLCRLLGLPVEPAELQQIERSRTPFKEEACRELCRALGVEVAASSYDDLESGALRSRRDWRVEQLLFARRNLRTGSQEIDLHLHGLQRLKTEAGYAFTETVSLPPEIVDELRQMRRRVRWKFRLLRPVSWLARTWRRLRETASIRGGASSLPAPREAAPASTYRVESAVLMNDRHRCRLTLAAGVQPTVVSKKPSAVFAFEIAGVTVTCTARRLSKIDEVLRKPSRAKVLRDENYVVGGLPARHLLFELPPSFVAGAQHPSYLALYVVRTSKALYVFLYRSARPPAAPVQQAVRDTVDSFRLLDD